MEGLSSAIRFPAFIRRDKASGCFFRQWFPILRMDAGLVLLLKVSPHMLQEALIIFPMAFACLRIEKKG